MLAFVQLSINLLLSLRVTMLKTSDMILMPRCWFGFGKLCVLLSQFCFELVHLILALLEALFPVLNTVLLLL